MSGTNRSLLPRTMEKLEDRILFDAVPDGGFLIQPEADAPSPEVEQVQSTSQVQEQESVPRELILVDANVEDADALISQILAKQDGQSFEVRLLDANEDGIHQISSILESSSESYRAIHILSHGSEGAVHLGNATLTSDNLNEYASDLIGWTDRLTQDADLLFYGCNLAGNADGEQFVQTLSTMTSADVAASIDVTGHETLGGNWDLEHQVGLIEASSLSIRDYFGTFGTFAIQATSPVVVEGDGGAGTTGTWSNAGFLDTDSTVDSDNDGDFENDQDMAIDMVATVLEVTGTASVNFETVSTTDPLRDDMRVRIDGDGSATIRWEIFEAGTTNRPQEGKIGLTISDIDGNGGPNTVEGIAASLHNLSSYTLQSPTNLQTSVDDDFLRAEGTQNQNDEEPSWVRFDWASSNELILTYFVYNNGERFFNHDGDGDLVFSNPNTQFTQGLDLDQDNSSGATGSNYQTTYVDGSVPGTTGDVPVSVADADIQIFDINDTMLQGASIVLTNASAGDQLNANTALLTALGITANVDTSVPGRIEVTLSGEALIENYETAIKSITYSNSNNTFDKSYVRLIEINATDGINTTGTATTTIDFTNAVNSPSAAADFYVIDEDDSLSVDAASGLLANDYDPQAENLTVTSGRDSAGNLITVGAAHTMPSGGTLILQADGSFAYTPPANFSGAEYFNYIIEDESGNTGTAFATININPVADLPTLSPSYTSTTVNEDELSPALSVSIGTPDSDGSESLQLIASGLSIGATLTDGTNSFTSGLNNDSIDITDWDLTNLRYQGSGDSDLDDSILLTLTTTEPNGDSQSVSETIHFSVNAVADAPNLSVSNSGGPVNQPVDLGSLIDVSVSDTDGSEAVTSLQISNIPPGAVILDNGTPLVATGGSVTVTPSQLATLQFQPPAASSGTYTLQITATSTEINPENGVAVSTASTGPLALTLAIDNIDDPVTPHADVTIVGAGQSVTFNVLGNDEAPDGGIRVSAVDGQSIAVGQTVSLTSGQGDVTLNADGTLTFEPSSGTTGTIQFQYTATDQNGSNANAVVHASITDPIVDDSATTDEDTAVNISVLSNDPTSALLPATITGQSATNGSNGETLVNADGTVTYTPDADFHGSDSFSYEVTGLAAGLQYQFFDGLNSWRSIDEIPDVDPDFVGIVNNLDSAQLASNLTGANTDYGVRYFGKVYVETADSYEFVLQSNNGSRLWVNGELVADNNNAGGSTTNSGSIILSSGYHDIVIEHYDWGGSASLTARMSGADTDGVMTNLLSTGRVGSALVTHTATVDVTVNPINDAPTVTSIPNQTSQDAQNLPGFDVSGYFDDVDGDTLTFSGNNLPPGLSINSAGVISGQLTSDASQSGPYTVSVTAAEGNGGSVTETFQWTVINPGPAATDDGFSTGENATVSGNVMNVNNGNGVDSDPDNDALSVVSVNGNNASVGTPVAGSHGGTFVIAANGNLSFDPGNAFDYLATGENATSTITYTISDGQGGTSQATVTVTITGANDTPTQVGTIPTQNSSDGQPITLNLSGYFDDLDGSDELSFSHSGSLPPGLSIHPTTGVVSGTIQSDASTSGPFEVTITVNDGHGGTVAQSFIWNVTNVVPVATDNDVKTSEHAALSGNVIRDDDGHGVDQDSDGDEFVVSQVNGVEANVGEKIEGSAGGIFIINADGSYDFEPLNDFDELDEGESRETSIEYTIDDGQGGTSTATLRVTVIGEEDPIAVGGTTSGNVTEDGALSAGGTLTASDVDTSDNPLTYTAVTNEAGSNGYGAFNIDAAGNWTYDLNNAHADVQALDAGETLSDSYTFTVNAADGATETQTVTVTITGAEDAIAVGGTTSGNVTEDGALTAGGTLTASDVDTSDNPLTYTAVTNEAGSNGYGFFSIDAAGNWTYDLNNAHADVQALDVGETLNDSYTFTVTAADGATETQTVTVTITGSEDAIAVGGSTSGNVTEDGTLTAGGTLTASDVDTSDNPLTYTAVTNQAGSNGYGAFSIDAAGNWSYDLNNAHADVQALDAGETLSDSYTFTVTAADGATETQTVTVTITGSEDAIAVGGTTFGNVTEDGALTAGGTLTASDVDTSDNPLTYTAVTNQAGSNGYGAFSIDAAGNWSYDLNNAHADVQALDAGETLSDSYTFTVTAADGATETQMVTVTITGSEDAIAVGGTTSGNVTEDGTLTAGGTLTASDLDTSDNPLSYTAITNEAGSNGYGAFSIDAAGNWTYDLNNAHADVQALDAGETLSDSYTFTVTSADGATETQTVTVTITGSEDAIAVDGTTSGSVTEDGTLTAGGTLTASDVDTSDNPLSYTSVSNQPGTNGYGAFSIDAAGNWTYDLSNTHADVQALDAGETLSDSYTFTVMAADGATETQTVTVTITGSEDAIAVGGTTSGDVTEDGILTAGGTLTASDLDTSDNPLSYTSVSNQPGSNGYGAFSIDAAGNWTYDLNNAHADVQALDAGETLSDSYTFTVTAADGATETQTVTVTITGSEDAIAVGGTTSGNVTEDGTLSAGGTLTARDVDSSDNPLTYTAVTNEAGSHGYGTFSIDAAGNWSYDLSNTHADVQALDAGETLSDSYTFTVTSADGATKTQTVTVTITGFEDAIAVGGTTNGNVTEDGTLTAGGTLTASDVDTSDNPLTYTAVTNEAGSHGYGTFSIDAAGNWTYDLNNTHADVQALDAGETLNDSYTFTVTAADGATETQTVTVTITGSEDAIAVGGTTSGNVTEDGALTAGGTLTASDVDTSDNPLTYTTVTNEAGSNGYGAFSIDAAGNWTYDLDNAHADVQALDAGETLSDSYTFTITAADGATETQTVTVTITGAEDAIAVGGTTSGNVTEDGTLTAGGTLTASDVDTSDNPLSYTAVTNEAGSNGYGAFSIDATGNWTYDLDKTHADVQALDAGETLSDSYTFTVTSADGATETQTVTVTITGSEDAIAVGGSTSGNVTEDGTLTAGGTLTASDVDTSDNPLAYTAVTNEAGSNGYGAFSIDGAGNWTYDLNNAHADVQALDAGETLSDSYTFTVTSADGATETQTVTVTITGAEDAIAVGGTTSGNVTEDGALTAGGTLTANDVDTSDNPLAYAAVTNEAGANGYGAFSIDAAGNWTYDLNNAHADVQALDAGETLSDSYTFTVTAADGATETQTVTVTITGSEDAIAVGGTTSGNVTEDGTLTAGGTLTASDVDTSDNPLTYTAVTNESGSNGYGAFSIDGAGNWTYDLNNAHTDVQALDAGETLSDSYTFTVTSADGATKTQTVTVTITGFEDAIAVGGTTSGNVTEDGTLTAGGTLTASDVDTRDNPLAYTAVTNEAGSNGYGAFSIDAAGNWTYDLSNTHADVQALDAGETLSDSYTFTVAAADGATETQTVTVTITGSEDAIAVGGTTTGNVTEDGALTAGGTLTASDVDTSDNPLSYTSVNNEPGANGYGAFSIDAAGNWTYDLDNTHADVQALDAGETLSDSYTFTVTAADGATETQTVTVTITGAEDAIAVGGTTTGNVTEDGALTAGGTLTASDVDTSDNPLTYTAVTNEAGSNGYGFFSIDAAGNWTYDLNNAHADVQALDVGETLNDSYTFTVTAADGATETQTVTVTITGSEDAIAVGGSTSGNVTEDGTLTAGGTLTASDVDTSDNPLAYTAVTNEAGSNGYGAFSIDGAGNWTYDLNNAHTDVQALDTGETLSDSYTFTVTAADGATETQTVTVTITGSEDAIAVGGTTSGNVTEDGTLTAGGTLTASDLDTSDNPLTYTTVTNEAGSNGFGAFSIDAAGNWTYDLNNAHADVQALDAGESLSDSYTFTVTAADGATETQTVTVTITGSEDAIAVGGTTSGNVTEDGALTAGGTLTASDLDTSDNPLAYTAVTNEAGSNGYGAFSIDATGNWTYDLNNAHADVQALDAGETLSDSYTFTVTAADGATETQTVTVTITGSEDAIAVGGTTSGNVTEDGALTAGGTLTANDVDTSDNPLTYTAVTNQTGSNGYGEFSIEATGNWTYDLNNAHTDVQALDVGETLSDSYTFTVTSADGATETQTVTVTITGAEDAIAVGGTTTGNVTEDGTLTAGGTLTASDVDTSDNPLSYTAVTNEAGSNGYGAFSIDAAGNWTYDLNNAHADVQALDAGESLSDSYTFTVTAADGATETQTVTVTITGSEDAIAVGGTTSCNVTEDGTLTAGGTLTASDLDTSDNPLTYSPVTNEAGSNGYGAFSIDATGNWTYDLNNAHADVQALDAGETLSDSYTFTVTAADGATETQTVTVTITGSEDAIAVGGTTSGNVTEDGTLTAGGTLTASDLDTSDNPLAYAAVTNESGSNGYGAFSIDATGNWTYNLNNTHADVQALDAGETLSDSYTFTVTAADGATETQTVTVTITGSEDAIAVGGSTSGNVTEDGTLTAGGTLTASDVDTSDNPLSYTSVSNQPGSNGYGAFSFDAAGNWTYDLNNAHADVQALDAGETLSDSYTFTVTAADGATETQTVTVTITGAEDAIAVGGTTSGNVTEDGTLTAGGTLTASDVDTSDNPLSYTAVTNEAGSNGYGSFSIDAAGNWTYDLNNAHADVQALDAGETLSDSYTFTVTAADGATETQTVTVTITGAEDATAVGGTTSGNVTEDGTLTAGGTLTANDVDTSDNPLSYTAVTNEAGSHGYGSFSIDGAGNWTYDLNNAHADVQALDAGESLSDSYTFTVTAADGATETQTVTVTITGSEDAIAVGGTTSGNVTEDGALTAGGTLTASDLDTSDNPLAYTAVTNEAGSNGYGAFSIDAAGNWTYDLDNAHADVQALDAGETLSDGYTFTVTAADGATETQTVTVTITGSEDAIAVGGTTSGNVTEDGALTAGGTLTASDVDTSDNPLSYTSVSNQPGTNGYGAFSIDAAGNWTFDLDNAHADVQALDAGESLSDSYTFTVTAADGATETQTVTVTITGAEDATAVGGTTSGNVTEDGALTAGGTLTASDADISDNPLSYTTVTNEVGSHGYGTFSIDAAGNWTFDLDNAHADVQALDAGESLSDSYTFTVTAADGATETQTVTVTITGAEDAIAVGGTTSGNVTEDGTLTAGGTLTANDVDTSDNPLTYSAVTNQTGSNGYGAFSIDAAGNWTYDLNNAHADVQALDTGETLSDSYTFTVTAADGATETQTVTVTITGSEDAIAVGGDTAGNVTEDGVLTAIGQLTAEDADDDVSYESVNSEFGNGGYGTFSIDESGSWTYDLNNAHADVQALDAGETLSDSYTFTVNSDDDGESQTQTVTVTITGSEDAIAVGGTTSGSVTEDGTLTAGGTLTASDVDTSDNPLTYTAVTNEAGSNGYGSFSIDATGNWTYDLNNAHADVQALDAGETLSDSYTFTVTAADGATETQTVTVTITGSEDAIAVGGTTSGNVTEDGTLTAGGTLTASDVDMSDNPLAYTAVTNEAGSNGYGAFSIDATGNWTYDLNNAHADVQALDAGETLSDSYTFTVTAADGATETQTVTVTITGSEDAIAVGGTTTGNVTEDGALTAGGTLTASDVDTRDNPLTYSPVTNDSGSNGYGAFSIDAAGNWTYDLSNAHGDVQALDAGETLSDSFTFTVTAADGATEAQTVTVTITGSEDAIAVGGSTSGNVIEDGTLTAGGTLTASDVDTSDNPLSYTAVTNEAGSNGYGVFNIDGAGNWTYDLNNAHADVQALDAGETLSDSYTFTVTSADGATETQTVTVTITGAEDAIAVGGTTSGNVTEDGTLTAGGTLTASDVDTSDNPLSYTAVTNEAGSNGYGTFSIDTAGNWTYDLDNAHADVQALDAGETLNDSYTFTITAADGATETQTVTVTITGSEDAIAVGGTTSGNVTEDGTLTAGGTLTASDLDTSDNPLTYTAVSNQSGSNGYGAFSIDAAGNWTYDLNNAHGDVQALDAGETLSDSFTFTVTAADGATEAQTVTVTITGSEDAIAVGGSTSGNVIEDGTLTAGGTLTASDVDTSDNPLSYTAVTNEAGSNGYGVFNIDGAGNWTYELDNAHTDVQALDAGETLSDSYTFTVTAADGATETQTVTVTITGSEDAIAVGGTTSGNVTEDGTLTAGGTLTASDVDTSDNPLAYAAVTNESGSNGYGAFSIDAAGNWTYDLDNTHADVQTLDAGETLSDSYTFTVTAADGATETQTVTVTITGAEDAPSADSKVIQVAEESLDNPLNLAAPSDVDDEPLTITVTGLPDLGAITLADGSPLTNGQTLTATELTGLQYDAPASYDGVTPSGSFTYSVSDGSTPATGVVEIQIGQVNDAPELVTPIATQSTLDGSEISLDIRGNFTDEDGDTLQFTATGLPPGLHLSPTGIISGTIDSSASTPGTYTTQVRVSDGQGGELSYSFDWNISNPAPIAADDHFATPEDSVLNATVGSNDTDPDGDAVRFTLLTGPASGDIVFNSDGTFSYTPDADFNGSDTFTYSIVDADGVSSSATVNIEVKSVNDAPITVAPLGNMSSQDGESASIDVSSYFSDPEGDKLTFSASNLPPGLVINADTGLISGTLDTSASVGGPYEVTVMAHDGNGGTVTQTFEWQVLNLSPIASADTATVSEDGIVIGNLITDTPGNDVDADGDKLTVIHSGGEAITGTTSIQGDNGGTFRISPDGSFLFNPGSDFDYLPEGESTATQIQYTISDGDGGTDTASVTIRVIGANDAPIAYTDLPGQQDAEGDNVQFDVSVYFGDPDLNDTQEFLITDLPPGLTADPVTGIITGQLPEGSASTTPYVVSVQVTDSHGASTTKTFEWKVTPQFAFDAFNNPLDVGEFSARITGAREVLLSERIETLAPEPILAGEAAPGTILVGRIYAEDGSVIGEVSTQANQAGNWVMQFFGTHAGKNTKVVIEHVATESVVLGESVFRLGEESYRSLQLDATHRSSPTAGTILSDAPSSTMDSQHHQNLNPLSFL